MNLNFTCNIVPILNQSLRGVVLKNRGIQQRQSCPAGDGWQQAPCEPAACPGTQGGQTAFWSVLTTAQPASQKGDPHSVFGAGAASP